MKVLFTGCTFNEEKILELKSKEIEIIKGRMDYTESELCERLKDVDCYINGGDEICTKKVIEENLHKVIFTTAQCSNLVCFIEKPTMEKRIINYLRNAL